MKLTIELDDVRLANIDRALRVSVEQYKLATQVTPNSEEDRLVQSILVARSNLELSMHTANVCHDYVPSDFVSVR